MGLFQKLFGGKRVPGVEVTISKPDTFDSPTEKYLKKATLKKNDGDINAAVDCLKSAYKIMREQPEWFSAEKACRLPLYLNDAGQNQEAWDTFLDIVKRCDRYSLSIAYDKMRLFLQRSGKPIEAVKYGVFSHLADMSNGFMVNEEAKEYGGEPPRILFEMTDNELEKLLKKAKVPEVASQIKSIANKYFSNVPDVDFVALDSELHAVLYVDQCPIMTLINSESMTAKPL